MKISAKLCEIHVFLNLDSLLKSLPGEGILYSPEMHPNREILREGDCEVQPGYCDEHENPCHSEDRSRFGDNETIDSRR